MHENGIRSPDGIANMVSTDLSAPAVRTPPLALALPLTLTDLAPNGRLAARTPLAFIALVGRAGAGRRGAGR